MPTAAVPAPHAPPPRVAARRTVDRARLVVLVPAHDEQAALPGTLRALRRQTARPAAVTVVADRCTDATPEIARAFGARVLRTRDNGDPSARGAVLRDGGCVDPRQRRDSSPAGGRAVPPGRPL